MPGVTDVLDMTVVDELIALSDDGDPELLLDLIGLFLSDSPSKLEAVCEGVQTGDLDRVERAARPPMRRAFSCVLGNHVDARKHQDSKGFGTPGRTAR